MSCSQTLVRTLLALQPRARRTFGSTGQAAVAAPDRADAPLPRSLRERFAVTQWHIHGRLVTRLAPRDAVPVAEVAFYHGGGYVSPLAPPHWWLVRELLDRTGAAVTVPSYPCAPEHTLDDALGWFDVLWAQALAREGRLVLAGDSAGAGLVMMQAIRARDAGGRRPDHLVLWSPWVDATMTNPDARVLESRDVTLRCDGLILDGQRWAGARGAADPLVSSLNDHLVDLPPILVCQGTHDIFYPDAVRFVAKARAAGTPVEFLVSQGGFHDYMAATWTPEAKRALAASAAAIRGEKGSPH